MAKFYDEIPEWLFEWIRMQHMFWVASAPLSIEGHVNVSPKGTADCFHLVNAKQVWYEDLSGSGIETISHVRENGRITIMFSAFEGPPRITRLFGIGTVHEYGTPKYSALIPAATRKPGSRAAVVVDVYQISTSCGYAVPLYDFVTHRTQLLRFFDKLETGQRSLAASGVREKLEKQLALPNNTDNLETKVTSPGHTSLREYWLLKNMCSLDGLPGLAFAPDAILDMVPQSNFDKNTRPMMHDKKRTESDRFIVEDHKGFVSGFVSGAVAALVFTALLGKLRR